MTTVLQLQTDTGVTGGIAMYIAQLVGGSRHEHVVVVSDAAPTSDACALYRNTRLVRLPPTYNLVSLVAYALRLRLAVLGAKVSMVHAHGLRAAFAAAVALPRSVPIVYTNHGLRYRQKRGKLEIVAFRALERFVCRRAAAVVCVRNTDARSLQQDGIAARPDHVATRIDLLPPSPSSPHSDNTISILGVGSLISVKRADIFVHWIAEALDRGVACSGEWVGSGPDRDKVQSLVCEKRAPVRLLGHLPRGELIQLYQRRSVLLVTSDIETLPISVLEAYSQGCPVITRRTAGAEEYVVHGVTGFIVDSAEEFVSVCTSLQANPALRGQLSAASLRFYAERHSDTSRMLAEYGHIYEMAMRRNA